MPKRSRQMELWRPEELPVAHRRCPECLGVYRVDRGCLWCASGGHARAEAARFANGWLVAQFPWKARTMPRAAYAGWQIHPIIRHADLDEDIVELDGPPGRPSIQYRYMI